MSVPIIDFKSESVLDEIRKAYTTVGFAVFTNTLTSEDKKTMDNCCLLYTSPSPRD